MRISQKTINDEELQNNIYAFENTVDNLRLTKDERFNLFRDFQNIVELVRKLNH